jgi:signal transduction histidine kinase
MIHNSTDGFSELQVKLERAEFAVQRAKHLALAGRFAAAAVHDINNPLEAISNLMYLLGTEPLSQVSARYLDVMEEQLDRARAVTQQILKLHRAAQRTSREDLSCGSHGELRGAAWMAHHRRRGRRWIRERWRGYPQS